MSSPNIEQMYKNQTKQPKLLEKKIENTVLRFRRLVNTNEVAEECNCSVDLIYKVLKGNRKDYYDIFQTYYEKIKVALDIQEEQITSV